MSHNPTKLTEEGWDAFKSSLRERYIKPMTNIVIVCQETNVINRKYSTQVTEEELQKLKDGTLALHQLPLNNFEYLEDFDAYKHTEEIGFYIEEEDL